jgi:hypothetical protein
LELLAKRTACWLLAYFRPDIQPLLREMKSLQIENLLIRIAHFRGAARLQAGFERPEQWGFLISFTEQRLRRAVETANDFLAELDHRVDNLAPAQIRFHRDSESVKLIPISEPDTPSPNISAGTMSEFDHPRLDQQLETFFSEQRALTGAAGDLTEEQSDRALVSAGLIQQEDLRRLADLRERIRADESYQRAVTVAGRPILIYFPSPTEGRSLFWNVDNYAAGHRNGGGTRIHISLPLALDPALGVRIGRHELIHIAEDRHESSLDQELGLIARREKMMDLLARLISSHVRASDLGRDARGNGQNEAALLKEAQAALAAEHYIWVPGHDPHDAVTFAAEAQRSIRKSARPSPRLILIADPRVVEALRSASSGWGETVVAPRLRQSTLSALAAAWGRRSMNGEVDRSVQRRFLFSSDADIPEGFLDVAGDPLWTVWLMNAAMRTLEIPRAALGDWRRVRAVLRSA